MSVSRGATATMSLSIFISGNVQYEVHIAAAGRQGPGLFWYHPHAHGFVNDQILGGLSGALIINGIERLFPVLQGLPERFLLSSMPSSATTTRSSRSTARSIRLWGFARRNACWRIAHIGASEFYKFRIEGMPLYVMATDGHALSQPRKVSEFFIGPGERIDAIAIGPAPGEYPMRTISYQNEAWRPPEPVLPLAVISCAGPSPPDAGLRPRSYGSVSPGRNGSTRSVPRRSRAAARWSIRRLPTARCS